MPIAILFFLSGMCALVYELVWTRMLGLILGNFVTATSVVLAVFMAGLAIGTAALGAYASRLSPARAVRLYAILEAGLALTAALSPLILSAFSEVYPKMAHALPLLPVRIALSSILLLIPTILMGGTLPALVRALKAAKPRLLGPLYAVNTAGAATGPLLAAFVLMPWMGMTKTLLATAALNAAIAIAAYRLSRSWPGEGAASDEAADPDPLPAEIALVSRAVYALAFMSGFLALASEVALMRQVKLIITGGSVYGFALVLSAFLTGIAGGAAVARKWPARGPAHALLGFGAALGVVYLFSLTTPFWDLVPQLLIGLWIGVESFGSRMVLNYATIFSLLVIPAAGFGYALPTLAAGLRDPGVKSIGRLFAANTLGATCGALAAGFWLLPVLGLSRSLLAIGGCALAAAAGAAALALSGRRRLALVAAIPLVALLFFLPRPDSIVMNAGIYNRPSQYLARRNIPTAQTPREVAHALGKIVFEKDGHAGHIVVRQGRFGVLSFIVNGKPDGSTTPEDLRTQVLSSHLGMLMHPDPRQVLLIGLGTGISAGSLSLYRNLKEVDVAEIEPVQMDVARVFWRTNYEIMGSSKLRMRWDDARHVLLTDEKKYDVIISEPSNLFVSGMVNLFTKEFFALVRERLNPGGVFLVWVHYYQIGIEGVRGVFNTFVGVFPSASYWLHGAGDSFLVGVKGEQAIDAESMVRRGSQPWIASDLKRIQIESPLEIMRLYRWGPEELAGFARGARVCTDDFPYLEFTSGRILWSPERTESNRGVLMNVPLKDRIPLKQESAGMRARVGKILLDGGKMARAQIEFARALELEPGNRTALAGMARIRKLTEEP